jgi:hypothetical protein
MNGKMVELPIAIRYAKMMMLNKLIEEKEK